MNKSDAQRRYIIGTAVIMAVWFGVCAFITLKVLRFGLINFSTTMAMVLPWIFGIVFLVVLVRHYRRMPDDIDFD
jgi:ABC-type enterochelin transport system permease subunit